MTIKTGIFKEKGQISTLAVAGVLHCMVREKSRGSVTERILYKKRSWVQSSVFQSSQVGGIVKDPGHLLRVRGGRPPRARTKNGLSHCKTASYVLKQNTSLVQADKKKDFFPHNLPVGHTIMDEWQWPPLGGFSKGWTNS